MRNFEIEKAKFEQDFEEMKTEVIERVCFRSSLGLLVKYCELFLGSWPIGSNNDQV